MSSCLGAGFDGAVVVVVVLARNTARRNCSVWIYSDAPLSSRSGGERRDRRGGGGGGVLGWGVHSLYIC